MTRLRFRCRLGFHKPTWQANDGTTWLHIRHCKHCGQLLAIPGSA